jgi:hypothetical protein
MHCDFVGPPNIGHGAGQLILISIPLVRQQDRDGPEALETELGWEGDERFPLIP